MTITESCPMCLEVTSLVVSHLIPKAVYKRLRDEGGTISEPVHLVDDVALTTSGQYAQPLLCSPCEQRLNRLGEAESIPLLASLDGFPLHDKLAGRQPVQGSRGRFVQLDLEADTWVRSFFHLAAGIIWKGSVAAWKLPGGKPVDRTRLGKYAESTRRYLLTGEQAPEQMRLYLEVATDEDMRLVAGPPRMDRVHGCHLHVVDLPGLTLKMFVGNRLPAGWARHLSTPTHAGVAHLTRFDTRPTTLAMAELADRAKVKGKLKESW